MSHQSDLIATDIDAYLDQHENKELLRFLTCGSVDDGKSTLIGRLLHDSKMIYEDQLAAIQNDSKKVGTTGEEVDLALLVDGLQAEREQGITIDVAYRYFSTSKRKFIIADTPGHEQYTRNMATGASTCDLAIILIDARHGVQVQTRRHSFIVSLLGIKHTLVAINKMDLVDFSQERFEEIKQDYLKFAQGLGLKDIHFTPISALKGDNVVNPSENMPWYTGESLMQTLENVEIAGDANFDELRFPVQYVNRPNLNFRGYCGTLSAGIVRPGDEVTVLPSGKSSKVKSIVTFDGDLQEAFAPMSVTLTLEDEIDISRGDILVHSHQVPEVTSRFGAHLVWMSEQELVPGRSYEIKLASTRTAGRVNAIRHRIDVNTLEQTPAATLGLNEIAQVEITLERPVVADDYRRHKGTGSFIIVDRLTNATVAAGMIEAATTDEAAIELQDQPVVTTELRAQRCGQTAALIRLQGGKDELRNTLMFTLEQQLFNRGRLPLALTGQNDAQAEALKAAGLLLLTDQDQPAADLVLELDGLQDLTPAAQVSALLQQIEQAGLI
ncbi:sulfate adenylyltransferase subunit CysN [Marinobacterium sediminicola]|uniref:Sulfate adenylyltransferase subunit 1 n=1 Tax=Marinobacterium sediminicola TaxID=518898 RepID=A0ABY1RWJ7_9GAMM|nr:sulfate adenylyltransferase subunit CysN [Marinobacterium sediminicola]ULG70311.1 sulfate adenylyltransferase subunit CysN [Marinobacterium sediminicola]SMR69771.1 bifunctional enzyme CysN/CysC [Marinobacterium sediminicola]